MRCSSSQVGCPFPCQPRASLGPASNTRRDSHRGVHVCGTLQRAPLEDMVSARINDQQCSTLRLLFSPKLGPVLVSLHCRAQRRLRLARAKASASVHSPTVCCKRWQQVQINEDCLCCTSWAKSSLVLFGEQPQSPCLAKAFLMTIFTSRFPGSACSLSLAKPPTARLECCHHFCQQCITVSLKLQRQCPICKEPAHHRDVTRQGTCQETSA